MVKLSHTTTGFLGPIFYFVKYVTIIVREEQTAAGESNYAITAKRLRDTDSKLVLIRDNLRGDLVAAEFNHADFGCSTNDIWKELIKKSLVNILNMIATNKLNALNNAHYEKDDSIELKKFMISMNNVIKKKMGVDIFMNRDSQKNNPFGINLDTAKDDQKWQNRSDQNLGDAHITNTKNFLQLVDNILSTNVLPQDSNNSILACVHDSFGIATMEALTRLNIPDEIVAKFNRNFDPNDTSFIFRNVDVSRTAAVDKVKLLLTQVGCEFMLANFVGTLGKLIAEAQKYKSEIVADSTITTELDNTNALNESLTLLGNVFIELLEAEGLYNNSNLGTVIDLSKLVGTELGITGPNNITIKQNRTSPETKTNYIQASVYFDGSSNQTTINLDENFNHNSGDTYEVQNWEGGGHVDVEYSNDRGVKKLTLTKYTDSSKNTDSNFTATVNKEFTVLADNDFITETFEIKDSAYGVRGGQDYNLQGIDVSQFCNISFKITKKIGTVETSKIFGSGEGEDDKGLFAPIRVKPEEVDREWIRSYGEWNDGDILTLGTDTQKYEVFNVGLANETLEDGTSLQNMPGQKKFQIKKVGETAAYEGVTTGTILKKVVEKNLTVGYDDDDAENIFENEVFKIKLEREEDARNASEGSITYNFKVTISKPDDDFVMPHGSYLFTIMYNNVDMGVTPYGIQGGSGRIPPTSNVQSFIVTYEKFNATLEAIEEDATNNIPVNTYVIVSDYFGKSLENKDKDSNDIFTYDNNSLILVHDNVGDLDSKHSVDTVDWPSKLNGGVTNGNSLPVKIRSRQGIMAIQLKSREWYASGPNAGEVLPFNANVSSSKGRFYIRNSNKSLTWKELSNNANAVYEFDGDKQDTVTKVDSEIIFNSEPVNGDYIYSLETKVDLAWKYNQKHHGPLDQKNVSGELHIDEKLTFTVTNNYGETTDLSFYIRTVIGSHQHSANTFISDNPGETLTKTSGTQGQISGISTPAKLELNGTNHWDYYVSKGETYIGHFYVTANRGIASLASSLDHFKLSFVDPTSNGFDWSSRNRKIYSGINNSNIASNVTRKVWWQYVVPNDNDQEAEITQEELTITCEDHHGVSEPLQLHRHVATEDKLRFNLLDDESIVNSNTFNDLEVYSTTRSDRNPLVGTTVSIEDIVITDKDMVNEGVSSYVVEWAHFDSQSSNDVFANSTWSDAYVHQNTYNTYSDGGTSTYQIGHGNNESSSSYVSLIGKELYYRITTTDKYGEVTYHVKKVGVIAGESLTLIKKLNSDGSAAVAANTINQQDKLTINYIDLKKRIDDDEEEGDQDVSSQTRPLYSGVDDSSADLVGAGPTDSDDSSDSSNLDDDTKKSNTFTYQWQYSYDNDGNEDWKNIDKETKRTIDLGQGFLSTDSDAAGGWRSQALVDRKIRVVVTSSKLHKTNGTNVVWTSQPTSVVLNVEQEAEGTPIIVGDVRESVVGGTNEVEVDIDADINALFDHDNKTYNDDLEEQGTEKEFNEITYLWQMAEDDTGLNTIDAPTKIGHINTNNSYIMPETQDIVGKYLRIRVSTVDKRGGTSIRYSAWSQIQNVNDPVAITNGADNLAIKNINPGTLSLSGEVKFTDEDRKPYPTNGKYSETHVVTHELISMVAKRSDGTTKFFEFDSNGNTWDDAIFNQTHFNDLDNAFGVTLQDYNGNDETVERKALWNYAVAAAKLDFLAKDETVDIDYDVTISDQNGSTATQRFKFKITGNNQQPTLTVQSGSTADGEAIENTTSGYSMTGILDFTDLDLSDRPTASRTNVTVLWTKADSSTASSTPGVIDFANSDYFVLSVPDPNTNPNTNNGEIHWTYTIPQPSGIDNSLEFLAANETLTITNTVTIDDDISESNSTKSIDVIITITGTNDNPTITTAIEDQSDNEGDISLSGKLEFADIDDTDTITITSALTSDSVWSTGGTIITENKENIEAGFVIGGTSIAAPGEAAWTYAVNETHLDFLSSGETVTLTYTVTATDNNGGDVTDTVTFTITGTNDVPTITAVTVSGSLTEDAATQSVTGSFTFNDLDINSTPEISVISRNYVWKDSNDQVISTPEIDYIDDIKSYFTIDVLNSVVDNQGVFTMNAGHNTGTVTWTYTISSDNASKFDFLSKDDTLTLTNTVKVDDGSGEAQPRQDIVITITGTNDTPLLSTTAVQTGNITEDDPGVINGYITATGSLTSIDHDNDKVLTWKLVKTETVNDVTTTTLEDEIVGEYGTLNIVSNTGDWTYVILNSSIQYLNEGVSVTDVFNVNIKDNHAAELNKTLTITITGINDDPVITSGVVDVDINEDENGVAKITNVSGLTSTDADDGSTAEWSVVDGAGNYGTLSIVSSTGVWTYVTNSEAQKLDKDDIAQDQFTVRVTDDNGGSDESTITINLRGVNDRPTLVDASVTLHTDSTWQSMFDGAKLNLSESTLVSLVTDVDNDAVLSIDITSFEAKNAEYEFETQGNTKLVGFTGTEGSRVWQYQPGHNEELYFTYKVKDEHNSYVQDSSNQDITFRSKMLTFNMPASAADQDDIKFDNLVPGSSDSYGSSVLNMYGIYGSGVFIKQSGTGTGFSQDTNFKSVAEAYGQDVSEAGDGTGYYLTMIGSGARWISLNSTILPQLNSTNLTLDFYSIKGNGQNGGETPESHEHLMIRFEDGGTDPEGVDPSKSRQFSGSASINSNNFRMMSNHYVNSNVYESNGISSGTGKSAIIARGGFNDGGKWQRTKITITNIQWQSTTNRRLIIYQNSHSGSCCDHHAFKYFQIKEDGSMTTSVPNPYEPVPSFTSSSNSIDIAEGTAAETIVHTLTTANFATFSISSGDDMDKFKISQESTPDNTAVLKLKNVAEYSTAESALNELNVTVQATSWNQNVTQDLTFNIIQKPVFETTSATIAENNAVGDQVLSISVSTNGNSVTYELLEDEDRDSFTLDGNNLKAAEVFDYETKHHYSVKVRATANGVASTDQEITIEISDVDDQAPTITVTPEAITHPNYVEIDSLIIYDGVSATDNVDTGPQITVLSITDSNGLHQGVPFTPTISQLPMEGEVYTITYKAEDDALNASIGTRTITVVNPSISLYPTSPSEPKETTELLNFDFTVEGLENFNLSVHKLHVESVQGDMSWLLVSDKVISGSPSSAGTFVFKIQILASSDDTVLWNDGAELTVEYTEVSGYVINNLNVKAGGEFVTLGSELTDYVSWNGQGEPPTRPWNFGQDSAYKRVGFNIIDFETWKDPADAADSTTTPGIDYYYYSIDNITIEDKTELANSGIKFQIYYRQWIIRYDGVSSIHKESETQETEEFVFGDPNVIENFKFKVQPGDSLYDVSTDFTSDHAIFNQSDISSVALPEGITQADVIDKKWHELGIKIIDYAHYLNPANGGTGPWNETAHKKEAEISSTNVTVSSLQDLFSSVNRINYPSSTEYDHVVMTNNGATINHESEDYSFGGEESGGSSGSNLSNINVEVFAKDSEQWSTFEFEVNDVPYMHKLIVASGTNGAAGNLITFNNNTGWSNADGYTAPYPINSIIFSSSQIVTVKITYDDGSTAESSGSFGQISSNNYSPNFIFSTTEVEQSGPPPSSSDTPLTISFINDETNMMDWMMGTPRVYVSYKDTTTLMEYEFYVEVTLDMTGIVLNSDFSPTAWVTEDNTFEYNRFNSSNPSQLMYVRLENTSGTVITESQLPAQQGSEKSYEMIEELLDTTNTYFTLTYESSSSGGSSSTGDGSYSNTGSSPTANMGSIFHITADNTPNEYELTYTIKNISEEQITSGTFTLQYWDGDSWETVTNMDTQITLGPGANDSKIEAAGNEDGNDEIYIVATLADLGGKEFRLKYVDDNIEPPILYFPNLDANPPTWSPTQTGHDYFTLTQ